MYSITFGVDFTNRNQQTEICGLNAPIYIEVNSERDIGHIKKYVDILAHASSVLIQAKLIVSMNGLLTAIFIRDIFYVEVFKRIITIHHKDGETNTYAKLSSTEAILSEFGFTRVHRSYIVAINEIKTLSKTMLTLINGEEIPVSKTYYSVVKEAFLSQGLNLGK